MRSAINSSATCQTYARPYVAISPNSIKESGKRLRQSPIMRYFAKNTVSVGPHCTKAKESELSPTLLPFCKHLNQNKSYRTNHAPAITSSGIPGTSAQDNQGGQTEEGRWQKKPATHKVSLVKPKMNRGTILGLSQRSCLPDSLRSLPFSLSLASRLHMQILTNLARSRQNTT